MFVTDYDSAPCLRQRYTACGEPLRRHSKRFQPRIHVGNPGSSFNPASDFEYTKNGNGTVTITKYIGKSANVVIPEEIEGLPVTEITGLIPIVDNDFIKVVIFPSNVKSIDHRAIHSACSVEEVYVREGTQEIKNGAFKLVSTLTKIVLPDSLKKFGFSVFYGCTSLKHIKIPSKISVLSEGLFEESGLETIELSEGLEINRVLWQCQTIRSADRRFRPSCMYPPSDRCGQ